MASHWLLDTVGFGVVALVAGALVGLIHRANWTFGQRQVKQSTAILAVVSVIVGSVFTILALDVQNSRFQFLTALDCANARADPGNCIAQTDGTIASVRYYDGGKSGDFWLVTFTSALPPTDFAPGSLTSRSLEPSMRVGARVWQGKVASVSFGGRTVGSQEVGDDSFWFTIVVFFLIMVVGGAILDTRWRLRAAAGL